MILAFRILRRTQLTKVGSDTELGLDREKTVLHNAALLWYNLVLQHVFHFTIQQLGYINNHATWHEQKYKDI